MAAPSFKMFWSEDLPAIKADGGPEIALIAGQLPGFEAPPAPPPAPRKLAFPAGGDTLLPVIDHSIDHRVAPVKKRAFFLVKGHSTVYATPDFRPV